MRKILRPSWLLALASACAPVGAVNAMAAGVEPGPSASAGAASVSTADVRTVKYTVLTEAIRQLRGRVVVADFWSTT